MRQRSTEEARSDLAGIPRCQWATLTLLLSLTLIRTLSVSPGISYPGLTPT